MEMHHNYSEQPRRLRDMSMTDQLERAAQALLYNPLVFLLLPFLINLAVAIVMPLTGLSLERLVTIREDYTVEVIGSTWQIVAYFLLSYAASLITFIIVVNGVMASLFNRKLTIGQSLSMALSDFPRLVGAAILYFFAIFTVTYGLTLIISVAPAGLALPLAVISLVGLIYAWLRLSSTIPALVAEQCGPLAAVSRSLYLTRGSVAFILGSYLMLALIGLGMTFIFGTVLGIATIPFPQTVSNIISSSVTSTLVGSFSTAAMTYIYINMRVRKEGFDQYVEESE